MSDKRQLTAKQEKFALLYLELGNACEAMRRSYDVGKMDDRTTQKRAQELLHHPGVAARIAELQKAAADKAVLNREWVLTRLTPR
jgi:phage terminase small subunit